MNTLVGAKFYRRQAAALRESAAAMATPELRRQALSCAAAWDHLAEKAENPPARHRLAGLRPLHVGRRSV
ncbi:MAG: hypothetical protein ACYCZX_05435 [Rhodospirillaceae bacterium]